MAFLKVNTTEGEIQIEIPQTGSNYLDISGKKLITLPDLKEDLEDPELFEWNFENTINSYCLSDNQLGNISDEVVETRLCCFRELNCIFLRNNRIVSLPHSFGRLEHLTSLYLDNNKFLLFPEALRQLTNLKLLHLSDNQIEVIPEWIGVLTKLEYLYISRNHISSIPRSMTNLKCLESLGLSGNVPGIKELPDWVREINCFVDIYI